MHISENSHTTPRMWKWTSLQIHTFIIMWEEMTMLELRWKFSTMRMKKGEKPKEKEGEKIIYSNKEIREEAGHTCRPINRADALNPPRRIEFSCAVSNQGGGDTRQTTTGRPQYLKIGLPHSNRPTCHNHTHTWSITFIFVDVSIECRLCLSPHFFLAYP